MPSLRQETSAVLLLLGLALPRAALAQSGVVVSGPPTENARRGDTNGAVVFRLENRGTAEAEVRLSCAVGGIVIACTPAHERLRILPLQNRAVVVRYSTSDADGTGSLTLASDEGESATVAIAASIDAADADLAAAGTESGSPPYVTPDGGSLTVTGNSTGNQAIYHVENLGSVTTTYSLGCTIVLNEGGLVSCSVQPSVTIRGHYDAAVPVTFAAGPSGSGILRLTATGGGGSDYGSYVVDVAAAPQPGIPIVSLGANDMNRADRGACLTTGAGMWAAFQCGELFSSHSMPAFRTLERDHLLTLLYASGTARPMPTIAVDLTLPASVSVPDSFRVRLRVGGNQRSWRYASTGYAPGVTRRLHVSVPAEWNLATGVHADTIEVTSFYGATQYNAVQATGRVIAVNRSTSAYGPGWWVAGVGEIHPLPDGDLLVIEGDGSAAVYDSYASNRWRAPAGTYQDTIAYGTTTYPDGTTGTAYTRTLLDRTKIWYAGSPVARQLYVAEPVSAYAKVWAQYAYRSVGSAVALDSISIPPHVTDHVEPLPVVFRYRFAYGTDNRLDYIDDPAGRRLDVEIGTTTITFRDPGFSSGIVTTHTRDASGLTTRIAGRIPTQATAFTYVPGTPFLSRAAQADSSVWDFRPLQVAGGTPGCSTACQTVALSDAVVWVNGPLAALDTARIAVDAHYAPVRIVNPLADTTSIFYDPVHTLEVERIRFPNGRVLSFQHDALGRIERAWDETHSSGNGAFTDYRYLSANAPHLPTMVISPVQAARRDTTRFTYNTSGLLQTVESARRNFTSFGYNTFGQVVSVTSPDGGSVAFEYRNPRACAGSAPYTYNLFRQITAEADTTHIARDPWGNVCLVERLGEGTTLSRGYLYNEMNWLKADSVRDNVYGASGLQTIKTTYAHHNDGRVSLRTDPRGVTRRWRYDSMGRLTEEEDQFGQIDLLRYAAGSMVPSELVRRNGTRVNTYRDLLDRDTLSVYVSDHVRDTVRTTYDRAGNPTLIDGRQDVIVQRTYSREGTILGETQTTRFPAPSANRTYQYAFTYGPSNQRLTTVLPSGRDVWFHWGAGLVLDSVRYEAPSGIGRVTFRQDRMDRDSLITWDGSLTAEYWYYRDGRLRRVRAGSGLSAYTHSLVYDDFGRPDTLSIDDAGNPATTTWEYDRRDQITETVRGSSVTLYAYDRSGNRRSESEGARVWRYDYGGDRPGSQLSNRLLWRTVVSGVAETDTFRYDASGNQIARVDLSGSTTPLHPVYYYNGANRLYTHNSTAPAERQYRYDGLGRLYRQRVNIEDLSGTVIYTSYDGVNPGTVTTGSEYELIQRPGVDDPLVLVTSTTTCRLVTHGGRLIAARTNSGNCPSTQVEAATYSGAIANSYTFDLDRAGSFGLEFFRNRWYDSRLGRFTQEDPIGYVGSDNLYAYAGNNPASFTDPFGLCPICIVVGIGIIEGASAAYDIYQTYRSFRRSAAEGVESVQATMLGAIAPGPGHLYQRAANSLDALSAAARVADRGGLTAAGRALTKHATGQRAGSRLFPSLSGSPAEINAAAQTIVDDILTAPGTTLETIPSGRFRGGFRIWDPSGRGILYNASGEFVTFLERGGT